MDPWLKEVAGTAYLLLPLVGGAAAHGLCMRHGWLGALARPIDAGRTWRGRPIFGKSKTFRGPVAVAAGSAAVWALQRGPLHALPALAGLELADYATLPGAWLAALAGAAAEIAELPNSFAKRRLGIAPSATTSGPLSVLFYVWDQTDLLLGYWLALAWALPPTPLRIAASLTIALALHPFLTLIGYLLRMRPTAR